MTSGLTLQIPFGGILHTEEEKIMHPRCCQLSGGQQEYEIFKTITH